MVQTKVLGRGVAARMFIGQPERLAAAWRRERCAEAGRGEVPDNLLDACVESFIREMGLCLSGAPGVAWARTRGVLRLSVARGARRLYEEFGALRRCLLDALTVSDAPVADQQAVIEQIDHAVASSLGHLRVLEDPSAEGPEVPFGGLVVEVIEPRTRPHVDAAAPAPSDLH